MSTEATATGADANTNMVKMDLKELDLQQPLISSEEQKKKTSGPVPPELCDPLTGALLKDPVRANDGFVYDQDSLSQWFEACKAANKETHSPASYEVQPMDPVFRPDDATALQLDAYLTSAPNALTGAKNLQTLCSIFDLLPTKLSDMLATSLESWTPPTVVFFGNSSSGKSSLIERLAMVPLPRAETPCTRMAVILKLRHTMRAKLPRFCVVDSTTGRVLKEQVVPLEVLDSVILAEMEALTPSEGGLVSVCEDRQLEVYICSPAVPSIDLVDLPGLKVAPSDGESADAPQKVKRLVRRVLLKLKAVPSTVFVTTVHSSIAPNMSLGMEMIAELGIKERTIGVLTMCDDAGKRNLKAIPGRLDQTSADSVKLSLGYVATMTEPDEDEAETTKTGTALRLSQQAKDEDEWFTSQSVLGPMLDKGGVLGCGALVDKLYECYVGTLRTEWAPQTIFRLNRQLDRLRKQSVFLGLPAAESERDDVQLEKLRVDACDTAQRIIDCSMVDVVQRCYASLGSIRSALASKPASGLDLRRLHMEIIEAAHNSNSMFVAAMKHSLTSDDSAFKLKRFPHFIDAVVQQLEDETHLDADRLEWRKQHLTMLLSLAAKSIDAAQWVETCAPERRLLNSTINAIEPMKAEMLRLLSANDEGQLPHLADWEQVDLAASTVSGDGLNVAAAGAESHFVLCAVKLDGTLARRYPFSARLVSPSGFKVDANCQEREDGTYLFTYVPPPDEASQVAKRRGAAKCDWRLDVCLHGSPIAGSPFCVSVAATSSSLYVVGGGDGSVGGLIERYDVLDNTWEAVVAGSGACCHEHREYLGAVLLDGKLYIVGGRDGHTCLSSVERFDPRTSSWAPIPPMERKRSHLGVTVLDGSIYAVGGYAGGSNRLNSVERYDVAASVWRQVADLAGKREALAAGTLDGKIYAVGGRNAEGEPLSSVECYDPEANAWHEVAPMSTSRVHPAVGVLNGRLYAVGGTDSMGNVLDSVERFDPLRGIWERAAPMRVKRQAAAVGVLNNTLYTMGGRDASAVLRSVERYDELRGEWEVVAPMLLRRHALGAAVYNV